MTHDLFTEPNIFKAIWLAIKFNLKYGGAGFLLAVIMILVIEFFKFDK